MITNERQYQVTRRKIAEFEQALAEADERHVALSPQLRQAAKDGIRSQLDDLRAELAEYEALRDGGADVIESTSLAGIGEALIKARIARSLTQEELAQRLGVTKQQVQHDEAVRYASASLTRLQEIADVLDLQTVERFSLLAAPVLGAHDPETG